MALIGIDFGSDSCVVTAFKGSEDPVVILKILSFVAFAGNGREFGFRAQKNQSTNFANTICSFKQLLGEHIRKHSRFNFNGGDERPEHGPVLFFVNYANAAKVFESVEIASMFFSHIRMEANVALKPEQVSGCVIAVPSYFTAFEQKVLLVALGVAGLSCQFMVKETTAVALNYAFNKKLSSPINMAFVDFGHSSIQISICKISSKKLEVLAEEFELFGGRDIDEFLAEYFIRKLQNPELSKSNKKFCVELLDEVERMKMKMTTDTGKVKLQHLADLTIQRSDLEQICQPLFSAIEKLLQRCLSQSRLRCREIHSIEVVGGSCRIPAFQNLVLKVFGQPPKMTMEQQESVSRGALLRYSASVRRKGFEIIEKPTASHYDMDCSGFVMLKQIHLNFHGNLNEFLPVTGILFTQYVINEQNMLLSDKAELERLAARKKFEEFAHNLTKPGGNIENVDVQRKARIISILNETLKLKTGRRELYDERVKQVKAIMTNKSSYQRSNEKLVLLSIDKNTRKDWHQTFSFLKSRLQKTYSNFFKMIDKIEVLLDKKIIENNVVVFDSEIIEEQMKIVLKSIGPRSAAKTISPEAVENTKRLRNCLSSIHLRGVRH